LSGAAKKVIDGKQKLRLAQMVQDAQSVVKEGAAISLLLASTTCQPFILRLHRNHLDGILLDMPPEQIPNMNGNAKKDTYGRPPLEPEFRDKDLPYSQD